MGTSVQIRVLIFKDGDLWVAQGLEHDIGAQAKDLESLQRLFSVAAEAELAESMRQHGKPFHGIPPAPQHFLDLWEKRSGDFKPLRAPSVKVKRAPVHFEMALCA